MEEQVHAEDVASYSIQDECLQDASQGDKYVEQTNKGKKAQCRIAKEMILKSTAENEQHIQYVANFIWGRICISINIWFKT